MLNLGITNAPLFTILFVMTPPLFVTIAAVALMDVLGRRRLYIAGMITGILGLVCSCAGEF